MHKPTIPMSGVDKFIIPTRTFIAASCFGGRNLPDFKIAKTSVNKRLFMLPLFYAVGTSGSLASVPDG